MRRRWLEGSVVAVGIALVAARVLWHATDARRAPCPQGFVEDAARQERAFALLAGFAESRELVRRTSARRGRLCFGRAPIPMVTTEHALLLSRTAGDGETAARVAHLLSHLDGGFAPVDGFSVTAPCAGQVAVALRAEARAMDLELRLRARFGVRSPTFRFAFTDEWRAAPTPGARLAVIDDWLVAHPHGGEGVDALGDAYAARCLEIARARR